MSNMRISLSGLLGNAVRAIRDGEKQDADMYESAFDQLKVHLKETIAGEHTLAEFAEFYCLVERTSA